MTTTSNSSPIGRFLVCTAAFIIVCAGLQAAQSIVVPFLLSLTIALIFAPMVNWLAGHKIPHGIAVLLVILTIIVAGFLLGIVAGSSINSFAEDLPRYQAKLQAMVDNSLDVLHSWGIDLSQSQLREGLNPGSVLKFAGTTLASLGNLMGNAFLIFLTVLFILGEGLAFSDKLRAALGEHHKAIDAFEGLAKSINHYIALKAWISLGTGALALIWLLVLGVDYPILWAMLAFLLNFIPTFGSILAAVPPTLLALVQLGPVSAVLTMIGYLVINTVMGNVLEPRIMGKGLNLSALVVFVSLVFWGYILGPIGMLLSVPLTMMVKIALENVESTRWIAILLGGGNRPEVE